MNLIPTLIYTVPTGFVEAIIQRIAAIRNGQQLATSQADFYLGNRSPDATYPENPD